MEIKQSHHLTKKERKELRRQEKLMKKQNEMKKRRYFHIFLWLAIFFIISGSVFVIIKTVSDKGNSKEIKSDVVKISSEDWMKGNKEAKVSLIEYSDFQCPACAFYYPILKKISEEFNDKIVIVYRHFPLPIHKNAKSAAYAAEAAGRQGKFWEMHDMLFENQTEWEGSDNPKEIFIRYAKSLNLDTEKFSQDFSSKEIERKIESAYQDAVRLKILYTPTFFLNGKDVKASGDYESFKNIILKAVE
jgi:protein-disulfide isomerase